MLVVPVRRSSRCVTVRAPLPACRVTWKVPSRAPSGAKAAELVPTRSRTLPTKARARVGGGRATVKPAARTATWPSGLVTVTSRGPRAAVAPAARGAGGGGGGRGRPGAGRAPGRGGLVRGPPRGPRAAVAPTARATESWVE